VRIAALILLAVLVSAPAWAAQPVAPQAPLPAGAPPLNKDSLEVLMKALSAQQQLESGGPGGAGAWQMLEAKSGPAPAVWLLNSSTGELSFCTAPPTGTTGIICHTKK
jgi:hypothetical protein